MQHIQKKKYIIASIDKLDSPQKLELCGIISRIMPKSLLWCNEGSIVNLDVFPENGIDQIYEYVKGKTNA